jgi:hypothetical protein
MKRFQIRLGLLLLLVAIVAVCLWGFRAWQDRRAGIASFTSPPLKSPDAQ